MLTEDRFMSELHLRKPNFTYSACELFTKYHERIQMLKETGDLNYDYKNEWKKASFSHDVAYTDSKDSTKRKVSDKVLKNRA